MSKGRKSVPGQSWSRRGFLTASGALAAWPLLAPPASAQVRRRIPWADYPFKMGVASGEPLADGFVLWTRLAPQPLAGGGMPPENVEVSWQVAADEKMTKVVARGTAVATPELAHSLHIEVAGLEPCAGIGINSRHPARPARWAARARLRGPKTCPSGCVLRSLRASTTSKGSLRPTSTWPRKIST